MIAEALAAAIAAQPVPLAATRALKAVVSAAQVIVDRAGARTTPGALADALAADDVIYVGERHDQAEHHLVQLEVLKAAFLRRPGAALGLEMVSRDLQPALDDFAAGRMSDADFEKFWKKAWGFPYALYRPVLEFARDRRIPLVALNAPHAVIMKVARGGLAGLSPADRALLPAEVRDIPPGKYRDFVLESLTGHDPTMPPQRKQWMVEAMAAWNETMGESVARALSKNRPLVVLAGTGHALYDQGILPCAARRGAGAQAVVMPYPLDGEKKPLPDLLAALAVATERELGDYFWLLPN